ncbi:MAG: ATPase, T2SS/T4P/T4SS family [Planctomycetota bacterium]
MAKKQELPPIQFTAAGSDEKTQQENLERITPSPGYPTCVNLICDAIEKRSDTTVFDFTQQMVNIRYRIDGMWHSMPPMDRESGDLMMATLKQLAGMNYRERRAKQEGAFQSMLMKKKYKCRVISQGVPTGERIALYINIPQPPTETLEDLGINKAVKNKLMESIQTNQGMIIAAALPGEGFTSIWRATLSACDRLMRDFYVIEEKTRVEPEVINVTSIKFDESRNENPFTPIPNLLLQEPDVLSFTEPTDGGVIDQMVGLCERDFQVFTRIHGKHCIDALLRFLVHKPDRKKLAAQLRCVVCMKVIRKLCPECRIPYVPHPKLLAQLGIPQGRVRQFYKAFEYKPGMVDADDREIEPCLHCGGTGYYERTGIIEVLTISEKMRNVIIQTPRMDQLSLVAKNERHISMRDMGILAVASGLTSLEELQRVLKK